MHPAFVTSASEVSTGTGGKLLLNVWEAVQF